MLQIQLTRFELVVMTHQAILGEKRLNSRLEIGRRKSQKGGSEQERRDYTGLHELRAVVPLYKEWIVVVSPY